MTDFCPRDITPEILRALSSIPAVVLTGMRQVGKSTLLREHPKLNARPYVTLDDYAILQAIKDNPEAFLAKDDDLTIDEAQRVPELLITIKKMIDEKRRPGRYLLSGSANFTLLKSVSESLAGRAIYLPLGPLSRREIIKKTEKTSFLRSFVDHADSIRAKDFESIKPFDFNEVVIGGMPEICLNPSIDRALWFRGFEQTYLERDIRDLAQVADRLRFRNLLQLAAFRTSQLLNISELGRDAGLNSATAARYLSVMETSFVLQRVEPYLKNPTSRLIKSPKLFMADSGIACYLTGVHDLAKTVDEPLRGAMLETYVLQNLSSILATQIPEARLFFWHIQGRYEVDFVLETPKRLVAIEVKAASRWEKKDLTGLEAFMEQHPRCNTAILAYCGEQLLEIRPGIWAVPMDLLLS